MLMALPIQVHLDPTSYSMAIIAATISILIGGILFGVGHGFGIRRVRLLGAEEIGQGIISAAMVGALVAFAAILNATVATMVPASTLPACPGIQDPASSPYSYYSCNLQALGNSLQSLSASLARASDISGFASSLRIDVGVVSAQPFFALESASKSLYGASQQAQQLSSLSLFELQLADFIRSSALGVFLPAGLLLRKYGNNGGLKMKIKGSGLPAPGAGKKQPGNAGKPSAAAEKKAMPESILVLSPEQKQAVNIMKKAGGHLTQKELRRAMPYSEAKVSLIVTELEEMKAVKRFKRGRGNIIKLLRGG